MKRTPVSKPFAFLALLLFTGCGDDGGGDKSGVSIDKRARACDFLLIEGDTRIDEVVFGEGVQGTFLREAPNVAVSLIATTDSPMGAEAVEIRFVDDEEGEVEVSEVACADAAGEAIDNPKVSIVGSR